MASLTVIYWRDIPAQIVAETGRGRNRQQAKIELHRRFALAIDEAAMRDGQIVQMIIWLTGGAGSPGNVQMICKPKPKPLPGR